MMNGSALGSSTRRRIWRSEAPYARATSTLARLTLRTPANVLITIGKKHASKMMTILACKPRPNHSMMSGIRATPALRKGHDEGVEGVVHRAIAAHQETQRDPDHDRRAEPDRQALQTLEQRGEEFARGDQLERRAHDGDRVAQENRVERAPVQLPDDQEQADRCHPNDVRVVAQAEPSPARRDDAVDQTVAG